MGRMVSRSNFAFEEEPIELVENTDTTAGDVVGYKVVGVLDGIAVGVSDGCAVGIPVGNVDGAGEGLALGTKLGEVVGRFVGLGLGADGENVGSSEGAAEGDIVMNRFSPRLRSVTKERKEG